MSGTMGRSRVGSQLSGSSAALPILEDFTEAVGATKDPFFEA